MTADVTSLEIARPAASAHQSTGRTAAAGLIGNVLEWFDFAVYGYFASVIGQQFFPQSSPSAQQLLSFAVFALGFGARPIGSLVLGRVGDRIGRRALLVLSIALMGGSTLLIGLLPTYESIGVAAPLLLVLLRLIQGFSRRWRVHGLDGLHDRVVRRGDARPRQQFDGGRHDTRVHPRLGVGVAGACPSSARTRSRPGAGAYRSSAASSSASSAGCCAEVSTRRPKDGRRPQPAPRSFHRCSQTGGRCCRPSASSR